MITHASVFSSGLVALAGFAAAGQVAPVKPGLWEVHVDRTIDGQKAPGMEERFKNMPPERRQQMEEMMKARGIDQSGNVMKVCHTKETLDRSRFSNAMPDCKTTFGQSSGSVWKGHTTCARMHLESDTEIKFTGSKSYTSKTSSVSEIGGRTRKSEIVTSGKWLSADCGDVKPLQDSLSR
jgi:hypothetical protein